MKNTELKIFEYVQFFDLSLCKYVAMSSIIKTTIHLITYFLLFGLTLSVLPGFSVIVRHSTQIIESWSHRLLSVGRNL